MAKEVTSSSIVDKSVAVLDLLAQSDTRLTFTDIVIGTGFNKSTVSRVLAILRGKDLATFDERDRTYSVGPRLVSWAQAAWQRVDLAQITDGDLADLAEVTERNVSVSVRSGNVLTFIRTSIRIPYKLAPRVGGQSDLHCTAAGKVALAWMAEDDFDDYLDSVELDIYTQNTITDAADLRAEVQLTRERGYGIANREELWRVLGLAAPILDRDGNFVAAVSVWTPDKTATIDRLHAISDTVLSHADSWSSRFGLDPIDHG